MQIYYPILNEATIYRLDEYSTVLSPNGVTIDMRYLVKEITKIRTMIVAQDELFAPFVHELGIVYTWSVKTMATDGNWIFINPEWTIKLTFDEMAFVIYHEIMHCLLSHMKRGKPYNPKKFNRAADYEINAILIDTLDEYDENLMNGNLGGLYDKKFLNMPAEAIYNLIPDIPSKDKPDSSVKGSGKGGSGDGEPSDGEPSDGEPSDGDDPTKSDSDKKYVASKLGEANDTDIRLQKDVDNEAGSTGGGMISPELGKKIAKQAGLSDEEIAEGNKSEKDWDKKSKELLDRAIRIQRNHGRSSSGTGSALTTILGNYHNGVINWKDVLKRYVGDILAKTESKWTMPNKRYMASNPRDIRIRQVHHGMEISRILVCVDTSGSMGTDLIRAIINEIASILYAKEANEIEIILFNTEVYKIIKVKNKNSMPVIDVHPGGGTDFDAPLEYIKSKYRNDVALCIFFTDGDAPIPERPKYANDFIWIIYDSPNWPKGASTGDKPPFGKKILVNSSDIESDQSNFNESLNILNKLVTESIQVYLK